MDTLLAVKLFGGDLQVRGWFPFWVILVAWLGAAVAVGLLYVIEFGRVGFIPRTLLALTRLAVVTILAALLLRPVLETAHDDQKPRPVAVLVDVSQSMGNADPRPDRADQWRAAIALGLTDQLPARGVIPEGSAPLYKPADPKDPPWPTRLQLAKGALTSPKLDLLGRLAKVGPVELSSFGVRRTPIAAADIPKLAATEPKTALVETGIQVVGRGDPEERPAAVVYVTDGRENARKRGLAALAEECRAMGVPLHIYGVGVGSVGQHQIREVVVPDTLFVDDLVGVRVPYRVSGIETARVEILLHYAPPGEPGKLPPDLGPPLARKTFTITRVREKGRTDKGKATPDRDVYVVRDGTREVERKPVDDFGGAELTDQVVTFVPAKKDAEVRNKDLVATVQITYGGPKGKAGGKDVTVSDRMARAVQVVDRKIKVLVIDSLPRWDFKYLQRALLRDRRVEAKFLLLSADKAAMKSGPPWAVELADDLSAEPGGKEDVARLKLTLPAAEFRKLLFGYDLVVLGDVPGGFLDAEHQDAVAAFVAEGGGLIHQAGRWYGPAGWARRKDERKDTPGSGNKQKTIADILPVEFDAVRMPVELPPDRLPQPFFPVVAPGADRQPLVQLESDALDNADLWGKADQADPDLNPGAAKRDRPDDFKEWGRKLPPVYWYYPVTRLKAAAEAYLIHPRDRTPAPDNQPMPLLAGHYYGKGFVLFVGFDETWRWRLNEADRYFGRFWSQAVYVAGLPKTLGTRLSQLSIDNQNPVQGGTGQVSARLFTTDVRPLKADRVEAKLVRLDAAPGDKDAEKTVVLTPLRSGGEPTGEYVAPLDFNRPGKYALRVKPEGGEPASLEYRVSLPPDDEMAPGGMAEAELRRLAADTGGQFYREEDLIGLPEQVKPQTVTRHRTESHTLWAAWWVYAVLIGLLTVEWIGRKFSGMS